jgi:pimeloyl-ACP methyl ester carboxylesterase
MKKIIRILKKLFISLSAVFILAIVLIYTYHSFQLNKESGLFKSGGTLTQIGNKKMNVYSEGSGEDTYVFMPGSGIAAPVYEMKGLYSEFSMENKIAVLERAGYGYSDVFHDERDIDTILEQSRQALVQSGHNPPYILMPHSLSGLEAIYWAQKYPNEVKAIIAIDVGLPKQYATAKMNIGDSLTVRGMGMLTKIGFHRLVPSTAYNPEVIQQSFLTEEEKELYKAQSYKQVFNEDMAQELLQSNANGKKSMDLPLPKETPILFLDAIADQYKNSETTKRKKQDYEEFAEQLETSDVIEIRGTHSIYLYEPDEIYQLSKKFIQNNVEANERDT